MTKIFINYDFKEDLVWLDDRPGNYLEAVTYLRSYHANEAGKVELYINGTLDHPWSLEFQKANLIICAVYAKYSDLEKIRPSFRIEDDFWNWISKDGFK